MTLERARLKELLSYDPLGGHFVWRVRRSNVVAGSMAGSAGSSHGYVEIRIDGRNYLAHRLAWFYEHGEWPEQIDHINGSRQDNRLANLRPASVAENNRNTGKRKNNRSGFKGVVPHGHRWAAFIREPTKKNRYLGIFKTPEAAHAAYCKAGRALHGRFFNAGDVT